MARGILTVLAAALLAVLAVGAGPAMAGTTVGSFEVEGNRADDSGAGEPIDWGTPPPNLTSFTDASGTGDDRLTGGSKELEPGGWVCDTGSTPGKDDIVSGDIAFRRIGTATSGGVRKQFAYIDFTRASPNGDAHMDYEFNQSSEPNPACPALPARTDGDLAITFDTERGGAEIFVRLFEWRGNSQSGTFVEVPAGARGVTWDGAVNIPNTIPGAEAGNFGEAAINLSDTVGDIACGQFGSAHMKTRASTSINSEIKDRTTAQPLKGFCPDLSLTKEADRTQISRGDTVTYSLNYSNTGDGDATGVAITDELPEGTEFVACSDNCSVSGDGTVSWSIGSLPAGGSRRVTLTVRLVSDASCVVCNVATIDADNDDGAPPESSNEVCIEIVPTANPAGASSHDGAYGARLQVGALSLDQTLVPVKSSQSGVGSSSDNDQLLNVDVPADGSTLRADVMRTSSTSTVTESPARSGHTSTAETASMNVLGGLVTASKVRAVATTSATGADSSFSSLGSTFEDLKVAGVAHDEVHPDTRIDLPAAVYGEGSYVALFERTGSTSGPDPGQTSGGTYAADLTVNMIRVHVTDSDPVQPGSQPVDVTVASATAHSDFPQVTVCGPEREQAVSGHAFIAGASTDPELFPLRLGYVDIAPTGGEDHQELDTVEVPADGPTVTAGTSLSDSRGTLNAGSSAASSFAQAEDVCLLPGGATCTAQADLVRSESTSAADGTGASSTDGDTKLVGATVLGQSQAAEPGPNEVVELPGIGFVILNEQFCDGGAALPACAGGGGHAGLTVRAIRLVATVPGNPSGLTPGTEVIVAEAHSGATYR